MPKSTKSSTSASNQKNSRRINRNRPPRRRTSLANRRSEVGSSAAEEQSEADFCSICMEKIEVENIDTGNFLKLFCGHIFHKECIAQIVGRSVMGEILCPFCRTPLLPTEVVLLRNYVAISPEKYSQSPENAELNREAARRFQAEHFPIPAHLLGPRRLNDNRHARNLAAHSYLLTDMEQHAAEQAAHQPTIEEIAAQQAAQQRSAEQQAARQRSAEIYAGYAIRARQLREAREAETRRAGAQFQEEVRAGRRRNAQSNEHWRTPPLSRSAFSLFGGKRMTRKIYKCKTHGCKHHNHK